MITRPAPRCELPRFNQGRYLGQTESPVQTGIAQKRYSVEHRTRRLQRQLQAPGFAATLEQAGPDEQHI